MKGREGLVVKVVERLVEGLDDFGVLLTRDITRGIHLDSIDLQKNI